MQDNNHNNEKRPNTFSNILGYVPTVLGVAYGGNKVLQTLQSNHGTLASAAAAGFRPNRGASLSAGMQSGENIAKAMVNRPLSQSASLEFKEALTGGDRQRFLKLSATSFISTVSAPGSGFSENEIQTMINKARDLVGQALQDTSKYEDARSYMAGILDAKGLTHKATRGVSYLHENVKADLSHMMLPASVKRDLPSFAERMARPERASQIEQAVLSNVNLPGSLRVNVTGGIKVHGKFEFAELSIASASGGGKAITTYIPMGEAAKRGMHLTSQFSVFEIPEIGGLSGEERQLASVREAIVGAGEQGRITDVRKGIRKHFQAIRSFGTQWRPYEVSGQQARREIIRRNIIYPKEAFDIALAGKGETIPAEVLSEQFKKYGSTIEPAGPAAAVRGGVLRGNILGEMFSGMEGMDWSSNPLQFMRDMNNVLPSELPAVPWKKQKPKEVMHGPIYRRPEDLTRFKTIRKDKYRPVNPKAKWKELSEGYGYRSPHFVQLHVAGDESTKTLAKYGISADMGQAYVRANVRNALAFEQALAIDVFQVDQSVVDRFRAGGSKPMLLEPGTFLGNTTQGQFEIIPERPFGDMELMEVEERSGRTTFHFRRTRQAMEGIKVQQGAAGGIKATLLFRQKEYFDEITSQTMFGKSAAELTERERKLMRQVAVTTSTSGVFKQGKYGLQRQMTGALRTVVEQYAKKHGESLPQTLQDEIFSFLTSENEFEWLKQRAKTDTYEGFVGTVASFSKKWGLSKSKELGLIFGASFADKAESITTGALGLDGKELTPRQVAEAKIREFFTQGKADKIIQESSRGSFLTWDPLTVADTPWDGKGRESRLEIRTIDRLLESSWQLGDQSITEALHTGIMKGAYISDPSQIKTMRYMETAWKAAMGDIPIEQIDDDVVRMKLDRVAQMEASQQKWFAGQGAVLELPEQMKTAARQLGMSDFLYIPGKGALGGDLTMDDVTIKGLESYRDAQGEIGKQHFSKFIDDSLREIGDVMYSKEINEQRNALENLRAGIFNWTRHAVQNTLKIRLGPGSGHVQLQGMNDYAAMVKGAEWKRNPLLRQEGIERIGKTAIEMYEQGAYLTERQVFISKAQAEAMVRDVDFGKLGITKEEFLSGKRGMIGAVWRNPTVMQTSIQPAEVFVSQGAIKNVPLAFIADKERGGIAPGMKGDYDKDMLNIKLITDEASIGKLIGNKEQWSALERDYERNINNRQILGKALSKRMTELGLQRAESDVLRKDLQKQFGAASEEIYEKALGAHRLRTGKAVGQISRIGEEIMFALGHGTGGDKDMNALLNVILSEAEETGTLKARKAKGRVTIAEELAKAFSEKSRGGNIEAFATALSEEFLGPNFMNEPGVKDALGGRSTEDLLNYMIGRYNEYKGSESQDVWRAFFSGRNIPVQAQISAFRSLKESGTEISPTAAFLNRLLGGTDLPKGNVASTLGIEALNTSTIESAAKGAWQAASKHVPAPMLAGLLGSAALFSMMGGPGTAAEPLGPPQQDVNATHTLGRILNRGQQGLQPSVPGMLPQGGGPSVTGQLNTPMAPVSPMTHQVSVDVPARDLANVDYNGISRALRDILPSGNISSRITDYRRPTTPNDRYRDGY